MQLILDQITFSRSDFTLHAQGTFTPGVHLITGRVGSGKSTLGEIVGRALSPVSGTVRYDGISSSVLSMQFPEYHLTTTNLKDEILSWGRDPEPILETAGLIGRGGDDLLTLSRGELKRLHLACLITGRYDLMVLDEPFAGLDEEARYWISTHLDEHREGIIIIISHDVTTLPSIDQIWEMQDGVLTSIGHVSQALTTWTSAPPLIRYILNHDHELSGLSWHDLVEAVCRIHE
ncbi:MAG: ATP-binding cassette domain-containing protein [Methanospirillum sp.]|uniref:ATP-binding cassette domain-containing protein n=1 Tax=Methanospirillum sp. TaxID=45200 RepID=UPI00236D43DE|nr:ATP-binding cassette domain-containing protein [Methanospirillum sp.]MDD1729238.1 ATP-binding cassette domain-containing protein [Methanospirillum sp.]